MFRNPLLVALVALSIVGCSSLRRNEAAAPKPVTKSMIGAPAPKDLASIPDAIPRNEPRSKYGNPESYEVFGKRYQTLKTADDYVERGTASWYGPGFHAERTSSGEPYDMYAMTAAHKTLPLPVYARVTNLRNGKSVVVRINDRGPFVGDRIVDLSYTAAYKLDLISSGTAPVELRVLRPGRDAPLAPQPVTPVSNIAPAPTPLATSTQRFIQAGSFSTRSNAEQLVIKLEAFGISAGVRETTLVDRKVYRVHAGPVSSAAAADEMIERLRVAGIPDARPARD